MTVFVQTLKRLKNENLYKKMKFDLINDCKKASAFVEWIKTSRNKPIAVNHKMTS